MGKKIKSSISYFMNEMLLEDGKYFKLERGGIGNRLFKYYSNKELEKVEYESKNDVIFQFNLNKENDEMYLTVLRQHGGLQDADYLRRLVFTYSNNPRHKRERILFYDYFKLIEKSIDENKKLNIMYNGKIRTISPYFIKVGDVENRNYLFCYCEKNNDYRAYKISEISNINISIENLERKDEKYISNIFKNFDPFLSYGHYVKVRFNEVGEKLLKIVINNRPKIIDVDEENKIYTFECFPKLAQVYFSQFFENVEIIEPESLRKWFLDRGERLIKIYGGK